MTRRSVILGFLGACAVCGLSFLNDRVLKQTYLVGNSMPVAVYGLLIVFLAAVNPFLKHWRLSAREMTVVLALTLAACCVPGAGLLRTFTSSLILPHHYSRLDAGWREEKVLELVPEKMLTDVSQDPDVVLDGFVQGAGKSGEHIAVREVPWSAWLRPFACWLPMVVALWGMQIGLSLLVHRQWATHEHLPYPIASFADALLPSDGDDGRQSVLRSRLFWVPAGIVLLVYLNNFLCRWFPNVLIDIPTRFDFSGLSTLCPALVRGGGTRLLRPTLYFTVIGLAFLIPTDVSLAFGTGPFLWALLAGVLTTYGINLNASPAGLNSACGLSPRAFLLFGASLGVFVTLLYTGREYLKTVLAQAFLPRQKVTSEFRTGVYGWWLFAGAVALLVLQLCLARVGFVTALLFVGVMVIFFTVMGRLIAEAGLFYIQPFYQASGIIWGLFGVRAIGLQALVVLQLFTMVLIVDPRESLMPFMANSFRLLDRHGVKLRRGACCCGIAVLVGLVVALPLTLYIQYDQGNAVWEAWADRVVPQRPFANITTVKRTLRAQGLLEEALGNHGPARLLKASPESGCMTALIAGLVLFLLFAVARLHWRWWPLHPLLFVTWGTEPIWRMSGAFLVGWLIKKLVLKYGGANTYDRLKPVMFGLIAGEMFGALVPCLVGAVYYLFTGSPPVPFKVLPG